MLTKFIVFISLFVSLNSFAQDHTACGKLAAEIAFSAESIGHRHQLTDLKIVETKLLGEIMVVDGYLNKWQVKLQSQKGQLAIAYHLFLRNKSCVLISLERFKPIF